MSQWLDSSNNANNFKQTYVHGFVDISGGDLELRNNKSLNVYPSGDAAAPEFSINSSEFSIYDEGTSALVDVSNIKLKYLKNVTGDIESRLTNISSSAQYFTDNAVTNELEISKSFVPSVANTYNLGSLTKPFSSLYVNNSSIYFTDPVDAANVVKMSVSTDGSIDISSSMVGATPKKIVSSVNNVTTIGTGVETPEYTLDVTGNALFRNEVKINSNLTVDGTINFLGEFIQTNTNIQISEQMDLSNSGTGPALIVRQYGDKPVASFYDDATMVMTIKDGGDVSFNNSLIVNEHITCNLNLAVGGTLISQGNMTGHGDLSLNNNLSVGGDASFNKGVVIYEDLSVNGFISGQYSDNSIPGSAIDGYVAGAGTISVSSINSSNVVSNLISNVTTLQFDLDSGFDLEELSGGAVKVKMNSTFKTWKIDGETDLIAEGLDALNLTSDNTVNITTYVSKDLTYYVRANTVPLQTPYFLFSYSPDGTALNAERPLTLEKGYSFVFIRTDTDLSNSFNVGSGWRTNDTGISVTSTGTGPVYPDNNAINAIDANGEQLSFSIPVNYSGSFKYYNHVYESATTAFSIVDPINSTGQKRIHFSVPSLFNSENDQNISGKKTFTEKTTFNVDVSMHSGLDIATDLYTGGELVVDGSTVLKSFLTVDNNVLLRGATQIDGKLSVNNDISANYNMFVGGSSHFDGVVVAYNDMSLNTNLSVGGDVSMNSKLMVDGDVSMNSKLMVDGDVSFNNKLFVNSDTSLNSTLMVGGDVSFNNKLFVNSDASLNSTLMVGGDVSFNSKIFVNGDASLNATLMVGGDVSFNNKLFVNGDASMNSNLMVEGDVSFNNKLFVNDDVLMNSNVHIGGRITMDGSLNITDDVTVDADLYVNNISYLQTVEINEVLMVTDDVSFNSKLFVNGDVSMNADVHIGGRVIVDGSLNVTDDIATSADLSVDNYSYLNLVDITGNMQAHDDVSFNEKLFVNKGVSMNSTLNVAGNSTFDNNMYVTGDVSLNANLYTSGSATISSFLTVDNNTTINAALHAVDNVTLDSELMVGGDVSLNTILMVGGDVSMNSRLMVDGDVSLNEHLHVGKRTIIDGSLHVMDNITMKDISGIRMDIDHIVVGSGDRQTSTYLSNDAAGVTVNGNVHSNALLNYDVSGTNGTGVVFGNGQTLGNDEISLVTNGERRVFLDDSRVYLGANNQMIVDEITGTTTLAADSQTQLLVKPASNVAKYATMEIQGATGTGANKVNPSIMNFTNYNDVHGSAIYKMGTIMSELAGGNSDTNVSNMVFCNYPNGTNTRTETMKLTHDSKVLIDTVSNTYKLNVGGTGFFTGDISATNVNATTNVNTESIYAREIIELGDLSFNKTGVIGTTINDIVMHPQGADPAIGTVNIKGNLKVDGSINFIGDYIQTNTNVQVTEQLDISNNGTGPALIARQHGTADIAAFYDDNTLSMIIKGDAGNGGYVGIGTETPSEKLDVNGSIKVADGQSIYIGAGNASGDERLSLSHTGTSSHIDYGSGKFHLRKSDNANILTADSSGNVGIGTDTPVVKLAINSTDAIKIPVGTTEQRPTAATSDEHGYIRYNTQLSSFEGFGAGNAWGSLGGVKDVDQDTYISAENNAGDDNDELKFVTSTTERMIIDASGHVGIGSSIPIHELDVSGILHVTDKIFTTDLSADTLSVQNDSSFNSDLYVGGDVSLNNNLTVQGNVGIGTDAAAVKLAINSTDAIKIPVGTTVQRPTAATSDEHGYIRYNTQLSSFEGFGAGDAWGSLGGVKDVDQDTYISAENNAGDDNDELKFVTATTERMIIDASGHVGIGSSIPIHELDVSGILHVTGQIFTTDLSADTLSVQNDSSFNSDLYVGGDVSLNSNLTVQGNVGIGTDAAAVKLAINSSDAIKIPVGTTAQRPSADASGQHGYIRYNTELSSFEGFGAGEAWGSLGGIKDVDQDTYITAETAANDDNDELRFVTAGSQHMIIDASGDIGIGVVDPAAKLHIAGTVIIDDKLTVIDDISLNGDLSVDGDVEFNGNVYIEKQLVVLMDLSVNGTIKMPGGGGGATSGALLTGTTAEREASATGGMIRYNTDRKMAELYTSSNIWSGIASYKTEQPPLLDSISQTKLSATVTTEWEKFPEIYKDAFDGRSYPIYLQTVVDVSYNLLTGQTSNGWKTIYIGNGNYNTSGASTTPLTSLTFTAATGKSYNNATGYNITFDNKPSTTNMASFTQDDSFDVRVYGVNNSGTAPIYVYMTDVGLKTTGPPGAVTVTNFESFSKTQFRMDSTFYLDSFDQTVTSGIDISHYDISYTLVDTQSNETVTDSGVQARNGYNNKNDIYLSSLKPGAKYAVNLHAKNALNTSYGAYGTMFTASAFTSDGNASRFINASDLNSVSHNGMEVTLNGNASINGHVNGSNSRSTRTLLSANSVNSYISLDNTSSFYINYGKQGKTLDAATGNLVVATFNIKNTNGTSSSVINYAKVAAVDTASIGVGGNVYSFVSPVSYTDKGKTANYSKGYVYSSDFSCTGGNNSNSIFNVNYPASTNSYYLNYSINSQSVNNTQRIDENGNTSTSRTTNTFYVDNYSSTPIVTFTSAPVISVTSKTYLFGIPSIVQLRLTSNYTISNFASHYIPYSSSRHSRVNSISKNGYSFGTNDNTSVYQNANYTMNYSKTANVSSTIYNTNTTSDFTVSVHYLNNSGTPSVSTHTDNTKDVNNIGKIFRDSANMYNGASIYFFNGTSTISGAISTNSASFATTYSSNIPSTLMYYNGRFVSGTYSKSYNGTGISAFSDWSSGYAVTGPNYSGSANTGIGGFKWIAVNVTNKKSGASVNLSSFKINGSSPVLGQYGSVYESYISYGGKFGALSQVFNSGATLWFNDGGNSNIAGAKSIEGALNTNARDAFIDGTTTSQIYLIVGLKQSASHYFTF